MSEPRLDHPEQDIRIGHARATVARWVASNPSGDHSQDVDRLLLLLDVLGLLPGQKPDDMLLATMPMNRKGEVQPRNANVGTSFSNSHYS